MKCKNCKYKHDIGNTKETGAAICTRAALYFPIKCDDNCHFIPEMSEGCEGSEIEQENE